MKWLIMRIDRDVVDWLNGMLERFDAHQSKGKQFVGLMGSIYRPRPTWIAMAATVLVLAMPFAFLREPLKTYWLFALLALVLAFFSLYIWRLALARQRFLAKREVDEFGSYRASPDDRYEVPPA
jgi:hypothetical protein